MFQQNINQRKISGSWLMRLIALVIDLLEKILEDQDLRSRFITAANQKDYFFSLLFKLKTSINWQVPGC